jgi:hypothetical protein
MTDPQKPMDTTTLASGMFCKACASVFPTGAGLRIARKPQLKCPECNHVSRLNETVLVPVMQGAEADEMDPSEPQPPSAQEAVALPAPTQASWKVAIDPGEAAALIVFKKGESARIQNLIGDIDAAMAGIDRLRGNPHD